MVTQRGVLGLIRNLFLPLTTISRRIRTVSRANPVWNEIRFEPGSCCTSGLSKTESKSYRQSRRHKSNRPPRQKAEHHLPIQGRIFRDGPLPPIRAPVLTVISL